MGKLHSKNVRIFLLIVPKALDLRACEGSDGSIFHCRTD